MTETTNTMQIGISEEADFEKGTWTFKMQPGYRVSAGEYCIAPAATAPAQPVDERKAFEDAYRRRFNVPSDVYLRRFPDADAAWEWWKAGRAALASNEAAPQEPNSLIASFPCTGECPQPYNGCTCSCHRMPGVKHIMPCCYPSEDAAPASAAQTDEQDKRDAERYRWLIANASLCCDPHDAVQLILDVPTSTGPGWQDRAGAYIDAALSASKDQA
jgi:hypothetical protein